ncbi:MAG: M20 family metallopeptidase [Thermoplasmata archaeon]
MEEKLKNEILEISKKIYEYAEIGSEERKSSRLLVESLRSHGFKVEYPYLNMETAFRAEWGEGKPAVGLLAEYDALPNGHSCGHNLIAAWAYGTAVLLTKSIKSGKVVVFGTPSEEGIGKYAGSKVIFSESGAFKDIDFVIGMHPDDSWSVGGKALADISFQAIFHGKSSHMADSPEKGINALDAAVTSYVAINNIRGWAKNDKHVVIGMIFREGGVATNIVPEKAVLEIDLRSSSGEFLKLLKDKVLSILNGVSTAFGTKLEIFYTSPMYENYVSNNVINNVIFESLKEFGVEAKNLDLDTKPPSGSTDEANVSKVVPTGHLDIKIGYPGIPGHSDDFREASNPEKSGDNLIIGIMATLKSIEKIFKDPELLKKIRTNYEQSIHKSQEL